MPTDPGWPSDPTEHTERLPSSTPNDSGPFHTARLPDLGGPPVSKWYRRKGVIIGAAIVGVLIVLGAVRAAVAPSPEKAGEAGGPASASAASSSPVPTSEPTTGATTQETSSAAAAGSWTMPNEVGQVLQDAQDDIQRVSGDPAFFSHSHDLLGDRFQILDRDWKVCTQNVPRGTRMSAVAHVDFSVVKLDETCP